MKKQIKSLVQTSKDVATELITKGELFSHQQERRLSICMQCPERSASGFCNKCGCMLKTKTKLSAAKCPLGKW